MAFSCCSRSAKPTDEPQAGPFSVVSCEVVPNAVCLIKVPGYSLHYGTSAVIWDI